MSIPILYKIDKKKHSVPVEAVPNWYPIGLAYYLLTTGYFKSLYNKIRVKVK